MDHAEQPDQNEDARREVAPIGTAKDSMPAQPATEQQLQETEQKIEKRMSAFERSIVRLTWAAVVISLLSFIVFGGQLYEMITGGTQTDKLVGYAKTQSESADEIAQASDDFTDSAYWMEEHMQDAANAMQENADATTQSVTDAEGSIRNAQNAFRDEQRAWVANIGMVMDVPEVGKPMQGYVTWINSGKTFARRVKPTCHWISVAQPIDSEDALMKLAVPKVNESIGVLAPNAQYKTILRNQELIDETAKAQVGAWPQYIWGEVTYEDVFKRPHTTVFCSSRQGGTGEFLQCPFHNDAD